MQTKKAIKWVSFFLITYICIYNVTLRSIMILSHNLSSTSWRNMTSRLKERDKTSFVQSDSTCRDIFEIGNRKVNLKSKFVSEAVNLIRKIKSQRQFLFSEIYEVLAEKTLRNTEEDQFNITRRSKPRVVNETLLDKLNWQIPYIPCKLKKYEADDIKTCVQNRLATGRKTWLMYIGDSKTRQQMEVLLDILDTSYKLSITTKTGESITVDDLLGKKGNKHWMKYKSRLNVTCDTIPGLFLRFIWAPNLPEGDPESKLQSQSPKFRNSSNSLNSTKKSLFEENFRVGAFDVLKQMISLPQEELPDLIILDGGTWQTKKMEDVLFNIDVEAIAGLRRIYPFLATLSEKTSVVMMLPEPMKEFIFYTDNDHYSLQRNENLEWYFNVQAQLLPRKVQIWDSFVPFAHVAVIDCYDFLFKNENNSALYKYSRFTSSESSGCGEKIHLGFRNIYTAVQQLLNYLCNPYTITSNSDYCCAV